MASNRVDQRHRACKWVNGQSLPGIWLPIFVEALRERVACIRVIERFSYCRLAFNTLGFAYTLPNQMSLTPSQIARLELSL